jgi:hypothetical protein
MELFRRSPQPPEPVIEFGDFPLDGESRAALDSIASVFICAPPEVTLATALLGTPLDLLLQMRADTAPLIERAREVGRLLLRRALGADAPSDAELRTAREALGAIVARVLPEVLSDEGKEGEEGGVELPEPPDGVDAELRDVAVEETDELLHEIGLEEFGIDAHLAVHEDDPDEALRLVWLPAPEVSAHVELIGRLYERLELLVSADPLLALERRAARWHFRRWSQMPRADDPMHFAWSVREQEFSLVARAAVELGVSPVESLTAQKFFATIPARQQRMARALADSFASIFEVREADGARLVLEDLADGHRYAVIDHNRHNVVHAGAYAFGRLLPWESGQWLRSPGMAFLEVELPGPVDSLRPLLEQADREELRAILIEEVLVVVASSKAPKLPHRVIPAESPARAHQLLANLRRAMDDAGLAEEQSVADAPPELLASVRDPEAAHFFRMPADPVLADWVGALSHQARPVLRARARRGQERAAKKGGKKSGKRHGRKRA